MARILLGVSGGIAAYKSLELARLATKEGHAVRVVMTPTAERFIGKASFEGIVGAPVLIDEFERDPTRGAFPGDPVPGHDPIGHLEVVANADAYLVAPASANTIAKLAAGIADSMLTTSFLACAAPRLVAPAMNDRMYRDAGDPGEPGDASPARDRRDRAGGGGPRLPRRARGGEASRAPDAPRRDRDSGAQAEWSLGRAAGPDLRGRHPRADRPCALHRQPLLRPNGPGPRGARSAARGRRHPGRRERLPSGTPGVRRVDVETAAELADALAREFDSADVLVMAAAPGAAEPSLASSSLTEVREAERREAFLLDFAFPPSRSALRRT